MSGRILVFIRKPSRRISKRTATMSFTPLEASVIFGRLETVAWIRRVKSDVLTYNLFNTTRTTVSMYGNRSLNDVNISIHRKNGGECHRHDTFECFLLLRIRVAEIEMIGEGSAPSIVPSDILRTRCVRCCPVTESKVQYEKTRRGEVEMRKRTYQKV